MKLVSEYLAHAVQFETLAAAETDPALKAELEKQAAAYHKLAATRAKQLGEALPAAPKDSN
jgi:hypothetical protein